MANTSRNTKFIKASPEKLYAAFTNPDALEIWLAPADMTGKVHRFDLRTGGGYEMSLYYADSDNTLQGKTASKEDRFTSRFIELKPPHKIVQAINFDSTDALFSGEMIMEATFEPGNNGTEVTIRFNNIPPGIKPHDNEAGTESTLQKLARYVAEGPAT